MSNIDAQKSCVVSRHTYLASYVVVSSFCPTWHDTFLIPSGLFARFTTLNRMSSNISVLFNVVVESVDRSSAAGCFTPALCTISKSFFQNASCNRAIISVLLERLKIYRNAR